MGTYAYTVHLEPAEEGGYLVTVPALPGCITRGETYDEALAMAEDCIRGFLDALVQAGQPIPREAEQRRPPLRQRDLSDVAGTWREDPELEQALAEQDQVDERLWR